LWGLDPWRAAPDEVNALRCRVGYVPDSGLLISNLSLYDNLVLPMRFHRRMTESEVARHAQELLAAFEIARLPQCAAAEAPKRLQQKIALARALSLNPELLVMDEPDQNLDGDFTRYLWQRLGEYKASGTAILAALKDDSIAAEIADRTVNVAASWHGAVWDSGEYRNA
jgi:ABC-type ATPase involved in cell division